MAQMRAYRAMRPLWEELAQVCGADLGEFHPIQRENHSRGEDF
jgi:hypothetical protein